MFNSSQVEFLVNSIDDPSCSWQDKLVSIRLLSAVEDFDVRGAVIDYLSQFLTTEQNPYVISELIRTLGLLGAQEVAPSIQNYENHSSEEIKAAVAFAKLVL